jgi:uncharacterized protein (TIGR02099 family)
MKHSIFRGLSLVWLVFAVTTILFAIALTLLRLGMPWANDYREVIVAEISEQIQHPVDIGKIEVAWSGHRPMVRLHDVMISEPASGKPLLVFKRIYIELDPWHSFADLRPVVHRVVLAGSHIAITRTTEGQIRFKGFEALESTEGASLEQIAGLSLSLRDIKVSWWDEPLQQQFDFNAPSLDFQAGKRSLSIDTHIDLPESLGERIHLVALAKGPLSSINDWQLRFYLQGRSIDVTGLPVKWPRELPQASTGELDLSLWGQWDRKAGMEMSGESDLYDVRLNAPVDGKGQAARFLFLDEFRAHLRVAGTTQNWQLHLDELMLATPARHWPQSGFSLAYEKNKGENFFQGYVDFIDVGDSVNLLSLSTLMSEKQLKILQHFRPDADLSDISFKFKTVDNAPEFSLRGHIDKAQWLSYEKIPGMMGISADVSLDENGGELLLDSQDSFFVYPALFYWPMEFQQLQARLKWFMDNDALMLTLDELRLSNEDAEIVGGAHLALGEGEDYPSLNMELLFPRAALKKVRRYIPYRKFKSSAARGWLQKAFISGEATNGRFSYQGPLRAKAFKKGKAKMLTSFHVDNAGLRYQKGWPLLRKLKGEIRFENASMHARIDSGHVFGSSIRRGGKVDIDNFYRTRVDVNASAKARMKDVLRFVKTSPLGKGMEDFLAQVDSSGRSDLALTLHIPLSDKLKNPLQVKGNLDMKSARLALPEHNVEFSKIKGRLNFSRDTYSAKSIKAVFRGQPVSTTIETQDNGQIEASTTGDLPILNLLPEARPIFEPIMSGQSRWLGTIGIPPRSKREQGEPIWLNVSSMLQGVEVDLPAPLGKELSWQRNLNVRYYFSQEFPRLEMKYGNALQVMGELEQGKGFDFHRAVVGLSLDDYPLPQAGISLKGHWPSIRIDSWNDVIKRYSASEGAGTGSMLTRLNVIDTEFGVFELSGRRYKDLRIQSSKMEDAWRIHLDSPSVLGDIVFPHDWQEGAPLVARLNRLHLPPAGEGRKSAPLSPLGLPGVRLEIDDFQHDGSHFTKLLLNTTPNRSGQTINLFRVDSKDFSLHASGSWLEENKTQRTHVKAQFISNNLGRSLVELGYGDNLVAGKGEAKGAVSWPGPAYDWEVGGLNGSLEFKFEDGMLRKVDPGLGRLLSLLSLEYLPRRLRLDFKDVAKEGFHYDLFSGTAKVVNGTVYSPGTLIDGPSAALALSGRTGLVNQTYKMRLELVPKFKSTVPIAVGVIAGPQTGLLVYLLDKMAEGAGVDFNRTVTLDYDITGTWDDPVITLLKNNSRDGDESDPWE